MKPRWRSTGAKLPRSSKATCRMASAVAVLISAFLAKAPPPEKPGRSEHAQHLAYQGMADDVALAEADHRHVRQRLQPARDVRQAREPLQQVGLVGIAGHDHGGMPAEPRQHHL